MTPNQLISAVLIGVAAIGVAHLLAWTWLERRERRSPRRSQAAALGLRHRLRDKFLRHARCRLLCDHDRRYRLRGLVPDEQIPGTLNVGHAVPTFAQALIFIAAVAIDPRTLIGMILAAVAGAIVGAQVVSGLPRRAIQLGMGAALLVAATLFLLTIFHLVPGGGDAIALTGSRFWIGLAANFALGALMTLGIGLYGPCLILVSLLGMNPIAAFPIMMGSCAFLMPAGSLRFVARRRYSARAAIGLAIGGVPAVLIAAYIVKSLPLDWLRWLVVIVVVYTADRAAAVGTGAEPGRGQSPGGDSPLARVR